MRRQEKLPDAPTPAGNIFRGYAMILGFFGLVLFLWGPMWFGGRFTGGFFEGANHAPVFGTMFMAMAGCAAVLWAVKNPQLQHRSLFWFAMGHVVLWLMAAWRQTWVWGPGFAGSAVRILGVAAFLLFYYWLTAAGEFPLSAPAYSGIFGRPLESWRRPVSRSQYEEKIRQAGAQEERNRLARDLHDSIKQQIFAIQTSAAAAQERLADDTSDVREALDQIRGATREAMTEMEVMLDQLRAEPLESAGLVEALKKLCESTGFRTGAQVEFHLGTLPPTDQMAPGSAEATLRVAQEALSNVARHARASHVTVSLDSAGDWMELAVKDDGTGFDPNQTSRGMGAGNMRRRADDFGGTFELDSRPGGGTKVKFSIPCVAGSRGKYRNRSIALSLMVVGFVLADAARPWSVWSLAPAVAFVAVIGAIHYLEAYRRVRTLSDVAS